MFLVNYKVFIQPEDGDEIIGDTPSESSSQAYQKIHVEPLARSSRDVSRSGHSWQPLSLTALQVSLHVIHVVT